MDTRSKIIPAEAFAADAASVYVVASLDPLLSEHAEALSGIAGQHGQPVTVLLSDPPDALLPAAARAELAAALTSVARVVVGGGSAAAGLPEGAIVIRQDAEDLQRRERLMTHVATRHRARS